MPERFIADRAPMMRSSRFLPMVPIARRSMRFVKINLPVRGAVRDSLMRAGHYPALE